MNETVDKIAMILAAIGAINWGLHAFDYGLVDMIFGAGSPVAMILYVVIGLSGIWALVKIFK